MDRGTIERFRLALFGRLAMGIAHDIDNHLSVVLGFAELLQMSPANEKKVGESAARILSAADRINAIVRSYSTYVRPHRPLPEPFRPADMISELLAFVRYDLGRGNVTLVTPSELPSGAIDGDRRDVALALICLLLNGAEAMDGRGGTLTLDVTLDGADWRFRVTDQGPGPSEEAIRRAFEEGFTTREGVSHTGMGLPVARAIAGDCGGDVTLERAPGGGCRATLRLPARRPGERIAETASGEGGTT